MSARDPDSKPARGHLSKKLRFEIFKRDSFACQYCGRKAPDVVLHCDHIRSVAIGGATDILNLITACFDCNSGKGKRDLSDQTVMAKQVDQLAELQERREQLEMMIEWRAGLADIQTETIESAAAHWSVMTEGQWTLSPTGKDKLRKFIKTFGLDLILRAMSESMDTYGQRDDNQEYTDESISLAFSKLGGVARVIRDSVEKPYLKQAFYIRGILRTRFSYLDGKEALALIEDAAILDVDLNSVERIAKNVRDWEAFRRLLETYIKSQREADK